MCVLFMMFMRLLIYFLCILLYYDYTFAGLSVLVPSTWAYVIGLITVYT